MKTKLVLRHDPGNRLFRLIRITYNKSQNQLTIGLMPRLLSFQSEFGSTILTILGVRIHFKNTNGVFAE